MSASRQASHNAAEPKLHLAGNGTGSTNIIAASTAKLVTNASKNTRPRALPGDNGWQWISNALRVSDGNR